MLVHGREHVGHELLGFVQGEPPDFGEFVFVAYEHVTVPPGRGGRYVDEVLPGLRVDPFSDGGSGLDEQPGFFLYFADDRVGGALAGLALPGYERPGWSSVV